MRVIPGAPIPIFRPAVAIAGPALLGMVAADAMDLATADLLLPFLAAGTLAAAGATRPRLYGVVLALIACLAGALRLARSRDLPPDHVALRVAPGAEATLVAVAATDPVSRPGAATAGTSPRGGPERWSFEAEATALAGTPATPAAGRIRVGGIGVPPALRAGDAVTLRGALLPPRGSRNPGQADYALRLRRRGIVRCLPVAEPGQLRVDGPAPGAGILRALSGLRAALREALGWNLRPDVAPFLGVLLYGTEEGVADDVAADFRRTGTLHLLAISGFHLMLLWKLLDAVLARVCRRRAAARIAVLGALAAYTLLTGLPASAVRSFLMIAAVTGADLAGRRRDAVSSLSLAALGIAMADPSQPFDAGYQLSFLAVLGILWLDPPLRRALARSGDPLERLLPPSRFRRRRGALGDTLRNGVALSTSAWLATGPLVAVLFHLATPAIHAANLLLTPLVCAEIIGAVAKTLTGIAGGPPDVVAAAGLNILYDLQAATARGLASIPGAWTPVAGLAAGGTGLYVAALVLWARASRWPRPRHWLVWPALAAALPALTQAASDPPAGFRTVALDVGQGGAGLCETPQGGVILYDGGSSGYADAGRSVIAPYLWSRGVTRIDLVMLSHPDADHVNGVPSLLGAFDVGAVAVSPLFDRDDEGAAILDRARRAGVPVLRASAGDAIEGAPGAVVDILGPPAGPASRRLSDNNASLLARVRGNGGGAALFTGDVEARGIAVDLRTATDPACDVVTVPHHGSKGSRSAALVDATRPRYALVSARRGFASRAALDEWRDAGAQVLRTWTLGAVMLETDRSGWRETSFLEGWR